MEEKMAAAALKSSDHAHTLDLKGKVRRSHLVASISSFAILKDYGFSLVTCADWMWEFVSWIAMCSLIHSVSGWAFCLIWFIWHNEKARNRHWRYISEYQNYYPNERRALIPYLF